MGGLSMTTPTSKIFVLVTLLIWEGIFSYLSSTELNTTIITGDFSKPIILTGSIKSKKEERFIVPLTNTWRVQIKWMVKEGEYVNAGDPVVRFDTSGVTLNIEEVENTLRVKKEQKNQKEADSQHQEIELSAKIQEAKIEYEKAKLDADIPQGLIPQSEYDQLQLKAEKKRQLFQDVQLEKTVKQLALNTEIKTLELEIQETQTQLESSMKMLKSLTLIAKSSGTIVYGELWWQDRKIQVGDTVEVSQIVAYIPDKESMQVEAWISECHVQFLKVTQPVKLILDAYPQRNFTGTVKEILNSAENKKNWGRGNYFKVIIDLHNKDYKVMKQGMSVKCIIETCQYSNILKIPLPMVHFDGHKYWVNIKDKGMLTIQPLAINEFYLALDKKQHPNINPNDQLLSVEIENGGIKK